MVEVNLKQVKYWLKNKNVLEKVQKRFLEHSGVTIEEAFRRGRSNMIDEYIYWSRTPEGHEFWSKINYEFRCFFRNPKSFIKIDREILFKPKEVVKVKKSISSEFVEISEDMKEFCGEAVQISFIDTEGYFSDDYKDEQDGCYYYIKEDNEINVFTSEMFERIKK